MWPKVDCWRKNLQISKPRASTPSSRRRLPEVNQLLSVFRHSLTHSPRWIHRHGYRRRRRSNWCPTAHELSKAGSAQIIPIYSRFSNAVAFAMLSRCSRIECLSPRTLSTLLDIRPPITRILGWLRYSTINLFSIRARYVRDFEGVIT